MSDDLVRKLRSQIGDDVQEVYSHEALFRLATARIAALETANAQLQETLDYAQARHQRMVRDQAALEAERDRLRKGCKCAMNEIRDYMAETGGTLPLELAMGWLSAALGDGQWPRPGSDMGNKSESGGS